MFERATEKLLQLLRTPTWDAYSPRAGCVHTKQTQRFSVLHDRRPQKIYICLIVLDVEFLKTCEGYEKVSYRSRVIKRHRLIIRWREYPKIYSKLSQIWNSPLKLLEAVFGAETMETEVADLAPADTLHQ